MKQTSIKIFMSLAVALLLAACQDDKLNSVYQIFDDNPASKTLEKNENHSEWVKILRYSDMYNALNQATQAFTLLVPDNEAVFAFYQQRGVSGIEDLGKDYAKALILHHTMLDSIRVESMQLKNSLNNLNGDVISVAIDTLNPGQFIFGGLARTTESGVHAYNALMYYVDAVLTPLVESVYDKLVEDGRYGIMKAALDATAWTQQLHTIYDTVPQEGGGYVVNRRAYALLAVSDEGFRRNNIQSFNDLVAKLSAGSDYTEPDNALNEYVAYHILTNNYTLADLKEMSGDTSRIWETSAKNQVFMITVDTTAGDWQFNILDSAILPTRFVEEYCDVLCKNGYLHEIDAYLPVWEPKPSIVVWDLANYIEVKNTVIESAGPEEYQPAEPVSSEKKIDITKCGAYDYVVSESGVGGSSYAYITYVTCKNNLRDCLKYDRVVFNLGYMGSVSMKTPTLVRGKYKVELNFVYLSDHNFMRQMTDGNGGMIRMTIDGENLKSVTPYTTVPRNVAKVYTATLYDEVEFEQTSTHDFKFVVMDPAASTNSRFSLQFDCITFTPIE